MDPADLLNAGTQIVVATITGGLGLWGGLKVRGGQNKALQGELKQAHNALAAEREAMEFERTFAFTGYTVDKFRLLCRETEIDRILLLVAWNGDLAPQWTKAEYQYRYGEQEEREYVHIPLDDDYRARLLAIQEKPEGVHYTTKDIQEGVLIRSFYDDEQVLSSLWVPIRKKQYEHGVCYSYMSYASHSVESQAPSTRTRCRLLTDEIRGHAMGAAGE